MIQIHLPEGSNGKTQKLVYAILFLFAVVLLVVAAFLIVTTIHEIRHW
jgi:hypothetical protein